MLSAMRMLHEALRHLVEVRDRAPSEAQALVERLLGLIGLPPAESSRSTSTR